MPFLRSARSDALQVATLCAFAVAQPLYALLGPNGEFFVAHGAGRWTVIALVLALSAGVPLLLVALELVVGLAGGARGKEVAHRLIVGTLGGLAVLSVLRHAPVPSGLLSIGVAAAVGVAIAALVRRPQIRLFLALVSPAIVLFPVAYSGFTPVRQLVAPFARGGVSVAGAIGNPAPIVFVVFDELTTMVLLDDRGEIDRDRFPNFAALAADGTWFRNAISAAPNTTGALPRLLTGRDCDDVDRLPILADYPQNLFTSFGDSYDMNVHESVTQLCPAYVCTSASEGPAYDGRGIGADLAVLYVHAILPPDVAKRLLPPLGTRWRNFRWSTGGQPGAHAEDDPSGWDLGSRLASRSREGRRPYFEAFVDSVHAGDRPALHFVHVSLPHHPFEYLPSGRRYLDVTDAEGRLGDGRWTTEEPLVATAYQQYVAQVQMTDMLLGHLIERLRREGLYDRALLIVTSDHGAAFVPGDHHREPNPANYESIYSVPLIVKRPGNERGGRVDDGLASSLDVVATIGDVLDVKPAWTTDGPSLFAADRSAARPPGRFTFPPFDVREVARRRLALLPSLVAPDPSLSGSSVPPALPTVPGLRAVSSGFFEFASVDLRSGIVPALVTGEIQRGPQGPAAPYAVAIAVNGRIVATTRTAPWNGAPAYFSALLSSSVFVQGANRLDFLLIDHSANPPRLLAIPSALPQGLRIDGNGVVPERLRTAAGRDIAVVPTRVIGWVDRVDDVSRTSVRLHGWAAAAGSGQPVSSVLVFAGADMVGGQVPSGDRPDVAAQFPRPTTTLFGYAIDVEKRVLARGCVRVLGLTADNTAGPLLVSTEARQMLNVCQ